MPTSEKTYRVEMDSLSRCVEHLRMLDLSGMETLAEIYGSPAERLTIAAVRALLKILPPERTHPCHL